MPGDELTGNVIQIVAYDLRLRAGPQNIVAGPLSAQLANRPPRRQSGF